MTHQERVGHIYQLFGAGNVPAILAEIDPACEWDTAGRDHGVPFLVGRRGRADVGEFFGSLQDLDFHRFEVRNLMVGGDQVAALIDFELTYKPTGRKIADQEIHLWTLGPDGKVVAFRHFVDTALFRWAVAAGE